MPVCVGQLHPITVYRIVFLGCALFWCWVPLCVSFIISVIGFYFITLSIMIIVIVTIIRISWRLFLFCTTRLDFLGLSNSGSANAQHLGCLRSGTLLYITFTFPTRVFYGGVPGIATDFSCCVWCLGLTTCLPHVGKLVWNDSGFVSLT